MDDITKLKAVREACRVERWHTAPHVLPYSVGHHQGGVASVIALFHPGPSADLLKAALFHDVPERWTGDIPAHVKWYQLDVKGGIAALEEEISERLEIHDLNLTSHDMEWLKAADMLDLLLHAQEEMTMGNMFAAPLFHTCSGWFREEMSVPDILRKIAHEYRAHRLSDDWMEMGA